MRNEAIDPITLTEAATMKEFGERNIITAKHLAETLYPTPLEIVCFHCQQAAEMMVKAVLLKHNIEVPKTHLVDQLLELLEENQIAVPEELYRQGSDLSPFATKFRYPNEIQVEKHHMDHALKCAEIIVNWCETFW